MQQETFIINGREFTCVRMNAFPANKLLLRIQRVVMPVFGSLVGKGKGKGLGDVDVKEAAQVIAANLDETLMDTIVLPMFSEAKVFCLEHKKFVKSEVEINQCFTTENLYDLYELIFEVGRYQFGPFFASLAVRFGNLIGGEKTTQESQES